VIEALGPLLLNVEIKADRVPPRRLVPAVVACVRRHGLGARALLSSFNPLVLAHLAMVAPEQQRALIFAANQAVPLRRAWSRAVVKPLALHPDHKLVDVPRVRFWHESGYAVNCWTVDDPLALARVAAAGVDGIIANDPGRARALLAGARIA
jgi:glycerophosphoryl diester phosphodiesterase